MDVKISKAKMTARKDAQPLFTRIVALVAKEVDGKVVSITRLYSKTSASQLSGKSLVNEKEISKWLN